jgi:predicted ATP-grasp superfamily ATP-dependent carboligase
MNYREVLDSGKQPFDIYNDIVVVLSDIQLFPGSIERIYRKAMTFSEEDLDRLRFALLRVQIYADIHRNEDMEQAQKVKYVAQVLEKIIFGSLLMEPEDTLGSMHE